MNPEKGDPHPFSLSFLTRQLTNRPPRPQPGILHTIFFHRFFPSILPETREVLDLTLPHVSDAELETLIDQRTAALVRQLDAERNQPHHHHQHPGGGGGSGGSGRGQVVVQFFERRRRKPAWYAIRGDEEVCWERWTVKVTVAEPRTESGELRVLSLGWGGSAVICMLPSFGLLSIVCVCVSVCLCTCVWLYENTDLD